MPSTVSISPMLLHKVQKGIEAFFLWYIFTDKTFPRKLHGFVHMTRSKNCRCENFPFN